MGPRFFLVIILIFCLTVPLYANDIDEVYRLDTGDVINVSVWGYNDLKAELKVGPDGRVSFPLLGEVSVRGCTLAEVRQLLVVKLAEFVRDPEITVILVERRRISVKVFGEVQNPGAFLVYPTASIAELIAMAGGPTKRAALEQVQLLRCGSPENVEVIPQGRNNEFGGGSFKQGPEQPLADGDVIFVPETKRIDWQTNLGIVTAILTALVYLKQLGWI